MAHQPHVIIGAGIGGLALGRCLLKHGIPTVIYEKISSVPRHNYAITLHPSAYRPLLHILKIDESTFRHRVAVDGAVGGNGMINQKSIGRYSALESTSSFRANRGKLEGLLREGLEVSWGHGFEEAHESSDGSLALQLESNFKGSAKCVIGVDGVHSSVRKSMSPKSEFNILPFVAFNGKRSVQRSLFDKLYAPAMRDTNVIELKQKNTVLNISINEQSTDEVNISWIYSRPSRGPSDPLHKPDRPNSGATDIPEEFYQEINNLQNLEQPFKDTFNAEMLRDERVLHWLMRSTLVSLSELRDLSKQGIYFMGDSIHAEPIIGGQGANTAMSDAVGLADCISKYGSDGISEWYETRYESWVKGVKDSEQRIANIHAEESSVL